MIIMIIMIIMIMIIIIDRPGFSHLQANRFTLSDHFDHDNHCGYHDDNHFDDDHEDCHDDSNDILVVVVKKNVVHDPLAHHDDF